jgi:hypothetical protein
MESGKEGRASEKALSDGAEEERFTAPQARSPKKQFPISLSKHELLSSEMISMAYSENTINVYEKRVVS